MLMAEEPDQAINVRKIGVEFRAFHHILDPSPDWVWWDAARYVEALEKDEEAQECRLRPSLSREGVAQLRETWLARSKPGRKENEAGPSQTPNRASANIPKESGTGENESPKGKRKERETDNNESSTSSKDHKGKGEAIRDGKVPALKRKRAKNLEGLNGDRVMAGSGGNSWAVEFLMTIERCID